VKLYKIQNIFYIHFLWVFQFQFLFSRILYEKFAPAVDSMIPSPSRAKCCMGSGMRHQLTQCTCNFGRDIIQPPVKTRRNIICEEATSLGWVQYGWVLA